MAHLICICSKADCLVDILNLNAAGAVGTEALPSSVRPNASSREPLEQHCAENETNHELSREFLSKRYSCEQESYEAVEGHRALATEIIFGPNETDMKAVRVAKDFVPLFGYSEHQGTGISEENKAACLKEGGAVPKRATLSRMEQPNDIHCTIQQHGHQIADHQLAATNNPLHNLPASLSEDTMRDFDGRNSSSRNEIVNNYLQSYAPTAICDSPVDDCQDICCLFSRQPAAQMLARQEHFAGKFKSHDYFFKHVVGVPSADVTLNKNHSPNTEWRLQKVLETLKEDAKLTKLDAKPPLAKMPIEVSTKSLANRTTTEKENAKEEDQRTDLIGPLLNVHRGFYHPPKPINAPINNLHLLPPLQRLQQDPPLPQFQAVLCSPGTAQNLLLRQAKFPNGIPIKACQLKIPRSPIDCPESMCQRSIFVSDFSKHLVVDHNHLPMERIAPFQCKNFFLDARLLRSDASRCRFLYLMHGKILDLGSSEYKNLLPLLVMTAHISIAEMCGLRSEMATAEYCLIWVTGIVTEELSLSVTLAVWSHSGRVPSCLVVYSGPIYSIRSSQSAYNVWQSGRMLLLSSQQIAALTDNGHQMLNVQLSVH